MKKYITKYAATITCLLIMSSPIFAATLESKKFCEQSKVTSLFNHKDLSGWHIMNDGDFSVSQGVLRLGGGLGWLRSTKEYRNFVLSLEFTFLKPTPQDGGVFLRAGQQGTPWPDTFYEVQLENSERIAIMFGTEYQRDAKAARAALKPHNAWNRYEIHVQDNQVSVYLNNHLVTQGKSLDNKLGYIGLQAENGQQAYKNICIKVLP